MIGFGATECNFVRAFIQIFNQFYSNDTYVYFSIQNLYFPDESKMRSQYVKCLNFLRPCTSGSTLPPQSTTCSRETGERESEKDGEGEVRTVQIKIEKVRKQEGTREEERQAGREGGKDLSEGERERGRMSRSQRRLHPVASPSTRRSMLAPQKLSRSRDYRTHNPLGQQPAADTWELQVRRERGAGGDHRQGSWRKERLRKRMERRMRGRKKSVFTC